MLLRLSFRAACGSGSAARRGNGIATYPLGAALIGFPGNVRSLFGFIIGVWAQNFEQLAIVPALIVTPLTFLGVAFYSIDILPQPWRTVNLLNPVVYLVSGFRWSFYGLHDVGVGLSLAFTSLFMAMCLTLIWWIFRTGYRLKSYRVWLM